VADEEASKAGGNCREGTRSKTAPSGALMTRIHVQEHEFDAADVCIHCHATRCNVANSLGALEMKPITCSGRWIDQPAPEPRRRISAADDFDGIGARLKELRAEQDAILAQTVTVK
jgi:hypothetical protein